MATAWVSRNMDKTDSLEASFFAIRQAIVEKLAKQRNLKISYDISYDPHDLYMDLAVCGEIEQIANLLEDLADQYGIAGIVVDLEKTEAAGSMIEGIEAGAFNVVIELDEA